MNYPWRWLAAFAAIAIFLSYLAVPRPVRTVYFVAAVGLYVAVAAAGLFFAIRVAPRTPPITMRGVAISVVTGIVIGGMALASVLLTGMVSRLQLRAADPLWKRLALALHAGTSEELVFRLFLLSALIWIVRKRSFWIPNALVAIGFGLAHLPAWAAITTLTPALVIAVVLVNGSAALALGWVYWRYGIVMAIVANVLADSVLWGLGPVM